jgi:hypothetical protein
MGSNRRDRKDAHGMQQRQLREAHLPPTLQVQETLVRQRTHRLAPRLLPLLRHTDQRVQRQWRRRTTRCARRQAPRGRHARRSQGKSAGTL